MNNIIWLASYPKSGNTWFRIFLTNLMHNPDEPADINRLENIRVASSRRLFDDNMWIEASDLTEEEVDSLRPELYRQLSNEASDPFFLKIHDAFTLVGKDLCLVPPAATRCVLYFIRNPLDVAVSLAHHEGIGTDRAIERLNDETFCFCNEPGRLDIQLRQRLSDWSGHIRSWTNAPGLDLHVVRYEEMISDPLATFGRASRFAGLTPGPARLKKAIRFSDINELRRQEKRSGFAEKSPSSPSFFNRGRAGTWKKVLNRRQVQAIVDRHHPMMQKFGYLDHKGNLA